MVAQDDLGFGRSEDRSPGIKIRPMTVAAWLLRTVALGIAIVLGLMMLVNGIT